MNSAIINGELLAEDKAVLLSHDLALQRGYAAFDYFRTVNNRPLFLPDYLERFYASAKEMDISMPYATSEMNEQIEALMSTNKLPFSGIRLIATGGYSPDSYQPVTANVIIQQQPLSMPSPEKFMQGVTVMTYPYQRDLPTVKSINYLMGIWLQKKLKAGGYDDVLYYKDEYVSEFPRANVFMVTHDGLLVTPGNNILCGITRKKIIEMAPAILPLQSRPVSLTELKNAAEVFMTSTTKRILPVTSIDGAPVGNGAVGKFTNLLNEAFLKLE